MAEAWSALLTRDAATVRGPDAAAYLQGQLSQDVAGLADTASAWSWILAPQGKVDALVRITRLGPEDYLLDTDPGAGAGVVERLRRFKLRMKADIEPATVEVLAVRGDPDADLPPGPQLAPLWRRGPASDVLVEAGTAAAVGPLADAGQWEAARIHAGVPVMGAELTERTIPAETGLVPITVSFTKGCYTGQELVARIDSRGGHVARHLRLLCSGGPLAPGDELVAGGKVVGAVTSAAGVDGATVALGYVGRAVEPGATVTSGASEVEVIALPEP